MQSKKKKKHLLEWEHHGPHFWYLATEVRKYPGKIALRTVKRLNPDNGFAMPLQNPVLVMPHNTAVDQ